MAQKYFKEEGLTRAVTWTRSMHEVCKVLEDASVNNHREGSCVPCCGVGSLLFVQGEKIP